MYSDRSLNSHSLPTLTNYNPASVSSSDCFSMVSSKIHVFPWDKHDLSSVETSDISLMDESSQIRNFSGYLVPLTRKDMTQKWLFIPSKVSHSLVTLEAFLYWGFALPYHNYLPFMAKRVLNIFIFYNRQYTH